MTQVGQLQSLHRSNQRCIGIGGNVVDLTGRLEEQQPR
jgi:hypothetical protein